MTTILSVLPGNIKADAPALRSKLAMPPVQEPTPPHNLKTEPDDEAERGRHRSRTAGKHDVDGNDQEDGHGDDDGNHANSSNSDGPARKRRRSRKGLDKKFECPHEGCGKSYSRAEHLYRHQLNHTPKQIYMCDYPDCSRKFVRLDLCNRHRDRHTAKGSALNRKDSAIGHVSPITDHRPVFGAAGSMSPEANRPGSAYPKTAAPNPMQFQQSPPGMNQSPYTPVTNTPPTVYPNGAHHNGVEYMQHDAAYGHMQGQRPPQHSPTGPQRPPIQTNVGPYGVLSPVSTQHGYHSQTNNTPQNSAVYMPPNSFPPFSLPPSDFSATSSATVTQETPQAYTPQTIDYSQQPQTQAGGEMMLMDNMASSTTIPVFGSDSVLNKSPYVGMPEDFMAYLFNTQNADGSPLVGQMVPHPYPNGYGDFSGNSYNNTYYGSEPGYFPASAPQQVMSVTNLVDQAPESVISEEKANELLEYIKDRFHEDGHSPVEQQKESILDGDAEMLSRKMMQAYIGSYWRHFSDQVPILHQPTFSADKTPNLLLLAIMTIGAACLDKAHGQKVTKAGAKLSNFLAWQLRWEIFMHPNFRPPAKLWVFQSLLLLELYEKMYSTRELHERAHIHHATTITLMRRGRSLIGKSALDSPPNPRNDALGPNGSRHSSTSGTAHTPDEWWNHWITNEATRRAAFTAFIIDSTHATMFGHSTVMVAHEMRLPLPCDEKLWKAQNGSEVGRIEANMMSNGLKPIPFLEGLKRTLSGQEVQTNSFGRTILMAGLLSVSWHMNQRDLQVNSLGGGVSQALGGRDKWRSTLTRAFDSWKKDFDKSLGRGDQFADPYGLDITTHADANQVFESRVVLHHLAHMAMHVDIVDCQIFARAKRLLGRAIGAQDLSSAQRRMKDMWAPSAKARDATYYALRFLCSVLLANERGVSHSSGYTQVEEPYSARDDVLLNRPWVLYFAVLVVWCYGYALEGPCPGATIPATRAEQVTQMKEYLMTFGSLTTPEDLKVKKGINNNSCLLVVLRDTFDDTRWELLHEGATLLRNCIALNSGSTV